VPFESYEAAAQPELAALPKHELLNDIQSHIASQISISA